MFKIYGSVYETGVLLGVAGGAVPLSAVTRSSSEPSAQSKPPSKARPGVAKDNIVIMTINNDNPRMRSSSVQYFQIIGDQ
jgi:hypothetical protein